MPIDEASIAQACIPWATKSANADCRATGSGVVRPVLTTSGGIPTPKVPTTPQGIGATCVKFDSACASHQVVEVLPLVPVTASTARRALG